MSREIISPEIIDGTGFAARPHARGEGCGSAVIAQAIASLALVLSLAVAVTAVTIGIARADGFPLVAEDPPARIAAAILFGLVLVGMGGLTALRPARHSARRTRKTSTPE